MEIKINNHFKVRHMPFSLSPTGDRKNETPQSGTFLNIFSIKDQNRFVKKSIENLKFTDEGKKKMTEPQFIPSYKKQEEKEDKRQIIKKPTREINTNNITVKANKQEKTILIQKKTENTIICQTKPEKAFETKETESNSNAKPKNITKEKYKVNQENLLKIFYYFRFHLHSLLMNCGKRGKIEEITNLQKFLPSLKKSESLHNDVFFGFFNLFFNYFFFRYFHFFVIFIFHFCDFSIFIFRKQKNSKKFVTVFSKSFQRKANTNPVSS